MVVHRFSVSKFPLTTLLLLLVTMDLVCRTNPALGPLLPWIDAGAVIASLGLLRFTPAPQPARRT